MEVKPMDDAELKAIKSTMRHWTPQVRNIISRLELTNSAMRLEIAKSAVRIAALEAERDAALARVAELETANHDLRNLLIELAHDRAIQIEQLEAEVARLRADHLVDVNKKVPR